MTLVLVRQPAAAKHETSDIPLLLISADRPHELHHSGANQTIDQNKIFSDHVRFFAQIPYPDTNYPLKSLLSLIDHAVAHAHNGPVHLNCMFRKPLDPAPIELPPLWPTKHAFSQISIGKRILPVSIP